MPLNSPCQDRLKGGGDKVGGVESARLDKEPGPSLCSWGTAFLRATVMVGVCACWGEWKGTAPIPQREE